jgi:hypothetical protein
MATTFRALVMLSVFVGLPAAWIYYGPLPAEAQRVVDRFVTAAQEAIGWRKAENGTDDKWVHVTPGPLGSPDAAQNYQPSAQLIPPAIEPVVATPAAQRRPLSFAERVEPLLARLRQLGVAEYALERWGDGGKLYRFHCEMPLGASAQITQQFESVAADPQRTVEQVVAEVAHWQRTRQAGGM